MSFKIFPLIVVLTLPLCSLAQTDENKDAPDPEIGVVEHLDEYVPEDIFIISEGGDTLNLRSLVDKPTILNLVYYRCPGICSPLMNGLAEVIGKSDLVLGKDYQVLTISFDPGEDTSLAARKRKNYYTQIGREVDPEGWKFFVADTGNILRLTDAVGFKYKKTGNDYLHSATLIMLSPDGMIARYLHGTYFLPFELKMSVIEASKGKSGPSINRVLQFCYSYDPEGQSYVLNVTRVAGTLIIFIALVILGFLVIRPKSKRIENS